MSSAPNKECCTAFAGTRICARGKRLDVARALVKADTRNEIVLVFDDRTGRVIDLDLSGSDADIVARYASVSDPAAAPDERSSPGNTRGRGRPKLGVVAHEVTLLPRHWDWLAAQPGGASAALRRLVDEARRNEGDAGRQREAREAAYRFMSAMAGDLPGFEEATRALFAGDPASFVRLVGAWPKDIATYALGLSHGTADTGGPDLPP